MDQLNNPIITQMIQNATETCVFKFGMSGVMVGVAGEPLKFREIARDMYRTSSSYARNFAYVGAIYAGTECLIASYRAEHDVGNSVAAGCFTGAFLARNAGPQAMALGCAGFAAFSAAIDHVLENYSSPKDE
ncbi:hypothetical protein H696_03073 [Fonticula alba]|uniref:Mitochondrial import inner membrane translocase subunit TIM22 n=1 Tax=Fonticula alba TaxID=691883 RepID=A0A058ZBB8_FONAL|nr:hypothetical protein H696_03073 [Fonticula alba]KCV70722.1 hypothetical protein H696_03073 [Fonticula alba]|eukprot:XP_009495238.1 hypothetical protein H696_03073 [Fonticula alba]